MGFISSLFVLIAFWWVVKNIVIVFTGYFAVVFFLTLFIAFKL